MSRRVASRWRRWREDLARSRTRPRVGDAFWREHAFAKRLVGEVPPILLAGLLYLGSGTGFGLFRMLRRGEHGSLTRGEIPWLAGAIFFGGILAPMLQMAGLRSTPAAAASLLLNLEGVFTAVLAWFAFRENFDRQIAAGMVLIVVVGGF